MIWGHGNRSGPDTGRSEGPRREAGPSRSSMTVADVRFVDAQRGSRRSTVRRDHPHAVGTGSTGGEGIRPGWCGVSSAPGRQRKCACTSTNEHRPRCRRRNPGLITCPSSRPMPSRSSSCPGSPSARAGARRSTGRSITSTSGGRSGSARSSGESSSAPCFPRRPISPPSSTKPMTSRARRCSTRSWARAPRSERRTSSVSPRWAATSTRSRCGPCGRPSARWIGAGSNRPSTSCRASSVRRSAPSTARRIRRAGRVTSCITSG